MYKQDLALNNLQGLICHKTLIKPNHIYLTYMYKQDLALNNPQGLICHKTLTKPNPYIHQLCVDTGCRLEDLPSLMADKERWQGSQRNLYYQHTFFIIIMMMRPLVYLIFTENLSKLNV